MKTYQAIFKEGEKNVFAISLVDDPATNAMFIALKKDEKLKTHKLQFAEADKTERTLLGVVLIPDKPIHRNQGGEEFNITFSKDTIKQSAHYFFTKGFQLNSSVEHEEKIEGISFVESWIVKDPKQDTANAYQLNKDDIVEGAWVIKMKCDNEDIYQKALRGEIKGFSIDGFFGLEEINLKSNITMSDIKETLKKFKDDILEVLNLKKEIKLGSVKSKEGDMVFNYDGDTPEVGGAIWIMSDDMKVPVPVGDIELEDGSVLVVTEEGIIGEIRPAGADVEQELDTENTANTDANNIVEQVQEGIKSIMIKYKEDIDKQFDELKKEVVVSREENKTLKKEVVKLSEQPAAKAIKSVIEQVELNKQGRILYALRN